MSGSPKPKAERAGALAPLPVCDVLCVCGSEQSVHSNRMEVACQVTPPRSTPLSFRDGGEKPRHLGIQGHTRGDGTPPRPPAVGVTSPKSEGWCTVSMP